MSRPSFVLVVLFFWVQDPHLPGPNHTPRLPQSIMARCLVKERTWEEMMTDMRVLGGAHQTGRELGCISGINECFALDRAQDDEGAPDSTEPKHQDQTESDMTQGKAGMCVPLEGGMPIIA